jgi:signal transduction histidine kinase
MRKTTYLLLVLLLTSLGLLGQVQPFSKKDSAQLASGLKKYKEANEKNIYRSASQHVNDIAFLYWNHNNYEEAIKYYEISIDLNKKVANENGLAMLSNNLGLLYADVGNYQKSLEYFRTTLATRRANNQTPGIISALINMSVVQNNLGEYTKSTEGLEEALTLAREINDIALMRSSYGMLSETYQKAGNTEKSLYYFKYYRSFHELSQKKKIENIEVALEKERSKKQNLEVERADLNSQLDTKMSQISELSDEINEADATLNNLNKTLKNKDLQLTLVEQEKELLNLKAKSEEEKVLLESRKKKNAIVVFSLIAGFLFVLSILVLLNRKKIREKNKLLVERNSQIVRINNELKEVNMIKDTLFSVIGHDLRGPLGQLEQTFDLLGEDMLNKEEKEMVFKNLRQNLKQATFLLENLLVWAKSQIHGQSLKIASLDLNSVVDQSLFVLESVYTAKNINLKKDYEFEGKVATDKDMLMLIIRNLTSNAIKFTPKNGSIQVSTGQKNDSFFINVIDDGVGMTQKQLSKLFEKTSLDSNYGTNNEKGMGIGLKLCKQYIDAMKGSIKVESAPNKGSSFQVLLPLQP